MINNDAQLLRTTQDIPVTPIDGKVNYPADFAAYGKGLDWVDKNGVTPLEHMSVLQVRGRDSNWETSSGSPTHYITDGGHLYLYPWPQSEGTLRFNYVPLPNALSLDTDVPFYGDPRAIAYHDVICWYAAWYLCMKDRDFAAADRFLRAYRERQIDLKENLRRVGDPLIPFYGDDYMKAQG